MKKCQRIIIQITHKPHILGKHIWLYKFTLYIWSPFVYCRTAIVEYLKSTQAGATMQGLVSIPLFATGNRQVTKPSRGSVSQFIKE